MGQIAFHTSAHLLSLIPHPYPAARHVPEWFKQMPMDHAAGGGTLKRCPPYLTAMTAGYIIPAPFDAQIEMTAGGELQARGPYNYLSTHLPPQFAGAPFGQHGGGAVVKFHNPWVIVTPADHVCLITAPLNRFEMPFLALAGIVETGSYYKEVQLPMACTLQPGQTHLLRQGAPMIQVIPIRRETWTSQAGTVDADRWSADNARFDANPHFYKDEFWRKMEFD